MQIVEINFRRKEQLHYMLNHFEEYELLFVMIYIIPPHLKGDSSWNPSSWKTMDYKSPIVSAIADFKNEWSIILLPQWILMILIPKLIDDLKTQGDLQDMCAM